MVEVGAGFGVTSSPPAINCAVMIAVPATVPNCTPGALSGDEEPAGIVNCAFRLPLEKTTVGSSGPLVAVNVNVRVAVTSTGYDVPKAIDTFDCVAGGVLAGGPLILSEGVGGNDIVSV